jgi:hypothetical protein
MTAALTIDDTYDVDVDLDRAVDDAGVDSFPASDPPSWWAGVD